MNVTNESLKELKKEYAKSQKCGAHFICASLLIWIFITVVNFLNMPLYYQNALSLYSSALLVPLALLFAKILKIKFSDKENPLNYAGLIFALNQMIYLLLVILVWFVKPEYMIAAYAIVVGAHFLPYSWLYDSVTYRVVAIAIPVLAFALTFLHFTALIAPMMVIFDIVMIVVFLLGKR